MHPIMQLAGVMRFWASQGLHTIRGNWASYSKSPMMKLLSQLKTWRHPQAVHAIWKDTRFTTWPFFKKFAGAVQTHILPQYWNTHHLTLSAPLEVPKIGLLESKQVSSVHHQLNSFHTGQGQTVLKLRTTHSGVQALWVRTCNSFTEHESKRGPLVARMSERKFGMPYSINKNYRIVRKPAQRFDQFLCSAFVSLSWKCGNHHMFISMMSLFCTATLLGSMKNVCFAAVGA